MDINSETKKVQELPIDTDYFESIYHLRFESLNSDEQESLGMQYRCYVACKKIGVKQICLFNLNKKNIFDQAYNDDTSSQDEE